MAPALLILNLNYILKLKKICGSVFLSRETSTHFSFWEHMAGTPNIHMCCSQSRCTCPSYASKLFWGLRCSCFVFPTFPPRPSSIRTAAPAFRGHGHIPDRRLCPRVFQSQCSWEKSLSLKGIINKGGEEHNHSEVTLCVSVQRH